MQKTLQNIAAVSFRFFIVLGALHITASLLMARGIVNFPDWIIFNILDLPFLFVALLYGSCKFSLSLESITGNVKIGTFISAGISILIFIGALAMNFLLPDAPIL